MAFQGFVHMEFYGDKAQVEAMLTRMEGAVNPFGLARFLDLKVDPYIRARMENRFISEGDDVSGPWAPLLPATQQIRANQGYGAAHPINMRTGELEAYITDTPNKISWDAIGAVMTMPGVKPQGKGLKAKVRTAQQGKADPSTKARPVMGVNEQDLAVVLGELSLHITYGVP